MGDDKTAVNALNKLLLFAGLDAAVVIIIVFFFTDIVLGVNRP